MSRRIDKQLAALMTDNQEFVLKNEAFLQPFFRLIREQALYDAADYATRMGNEVFNKMRKQSPEGGKRMRDLFYGTAAQIRSEGESSAALVDSMLTAMKDAGPTVQSVLAELKKSEFP